MFLLTPFKNLVHTNPSLERLARRLFDQRYRLARRHLRGIGVEIGALDRPLALPGHATAFYLDRFPPAKLREHYPELSHRRLYVSLVADGETLSCLAEEAVDFLVANHVIEHCEDPLAALTTFARKLKSGGRLFMAVPDMRRTFDRGRRETGYDHLNADHQQGPAHSREEHYREWAEAVNGLSGEEAARRARQLQTMNYSIHFHCWTRSGFMDFLEHLSSSLPLRLLAARSWRNENIFVLVKDSAPLRAKSP
jgi:predicted SAM-dependent methyltransferase